MTIDECKELIRIEPTIRSTLETIDDELRGYQLHCDALNARRAQLQEKLDGIEAAKKELASLVPPASAEPIEGQASEPAGAEGSAPSGT
jgi:hypothetical protein